MFNEDKAFRLVVDGIVVGCCRAVRQPHGTERKRKLYLCVFLARGYRSDPDLCSAVIQVVKDVGKLINWVPHYTVHIVYNFAYNTIRHSFGIAIDDWQ